MKSLLFLTVLAERDYAVQLLIVITAGLATELVDFVLEEEKSPV